MPKFNVGESVRDQVTGHAATVRGGFTRGDSYCYELIGQVNGRDQVWNRDEGGVEPLQASDEVAAAVAEDVAAADAAPPSDTEPTAEPGV